MVRIRTYSTYHQALIDCIPTYLCIDRPSPASRSSMEAGSRRKRYSSALRSLLSKTIEWYEERNRVGAYTYVHRASNFVFRRGPHKLIANARTKTASQTSWLDGLRGFACLQVVIFHSAANWQYLGVPEVLRRYDWQAGSDDWWRLPFIRSLYHS